MSYPVPSAQVPERLTEQEARGLIDAHSARYNQLREKVVAIRTRADEARIKADELLNLAQDKLGTRDEAEIAKILDDRKLANGQRAKAWLAGVEAVEQEIASVKSTAAPGR